MMGEVFLGIPAFKDGENGLMMQHTSQRHSRGDMCGNKTLKQVFRVIRK